MCVRGAFDKLLVFILRTKNTERDKGLEGSSWIKNKERHPIQRDNTYTQNPSPMPKHAELLTPAETWATQNGWKRKFNLLLNEQMSAVAL